MRKIILFSILLLLIPNIVYSGAPSRPHTYRSGDIVDPDENNANETTLYNYLLRGVDTYSAGSVNAAAIGANAVGNSELINTDDFTFSGDCTLSGDNTFSGNNTFSGSDTQSGTLDLTGTWEINGTGVTATAAELNAAMADGDTAGGLLGGTYPSPSVNAYLKDPLYYRGGDYFTQEEIVAFGAARGMLADNKDESYLENVITFTNLTTADLVAGIISRECLDFDTNERVLIAHSATQAGMTAITLEAWIYPDSITSKSIIANQINGYIELRFGAGNTLWVDLVTAAGTENLNSGAHGITTGSWWHIIITWDSASVSKAYVNGAWVADGDGAGNGAVSDSANGIWIGVDLSGADEYFDGRIAGVRILRRKMSAAEVLARYNTFK